MISKNSDKAFYIGTSTIPIDDNFESYATGSNINGQNGWSVKLTGSCSATIVDRYNNKSLNIKDDNSASTKIEVFKALPTNVPKIGVARFLFETDNTQRNSTIIAADGPWSEIAPVSRPTGAAMLGAWSASFHALNGTTWVTLGPVVMSQWQNLVEIYYKIGTGWHVILNGTKYGGDFGFKFAFGTPHVMNVFEVSTNLVDKNWAIYLDDLDFSWTPLTNAPVLSNGGVTPTVGTPSTFFTYSVNYTDTDNNPAESVNVTIDGTQTYQMAKQVSSDWNFVNGCMFSYIMSMTLAPVTHTYQFTCSDGNHVSTLGPFSGPYVNIDPVANFTQNSTSIKQGYNVQFTFTGSEGNSPATFLWTFKDGSPNSTARNPVHQFNNTGWYTITLLVTDSDGGTNFLAKPNLIYVTQNLKPVANFVANTTSIRTHSFVQFNYTGTEGDTPASFQWDFGDLSVNSTTPDPVHEYTSIMTHDVTVTVTDIDGDRSTMRKVNFITVSNNLIPVANFTSNVTSVYIRQSVQFTFTGFQGDAPANFTWNFGDGPTNSSLMNPVHQYNVINNFTVTLLVIDNNSDTSLIKYVSYIHILNRLPVANFTSNITRIAVNKWVQFNFTGSHGDPTAGFEWNFGDGPGNSTLTDPKHQYTTAGNFTAILTVMDSNGDLSSKTVLNCIRVDANPLPIVSFTANVTSAAALKPVQFTFTGFQGNGTAAFHWYFGDGDVSLVRDPVHQYLAAGIYSVNLTITDQTPTTRSMLKINYMSIRSANPPIVIDFAANATTIGRNSFVHFTFNGTEGGAPATFLWNFGDGFTNTSRNPIHRFTGINIYTVQLQITDNDSNTAIGAKPNFIHVINLLPFANFTVNTTRIYENGVVQFMFTGTSGDLPVTFWWVFGDGSPSSNARNPSHQFTYQGNYTISLQVVDGDWEQNIKTVPSYITVIKDLVPAADFTSNKQSIIEGQSVQFIFTGSIGNTPASFQWNFGDNSTNASARDPSHVYYSSGIYTVTLVVNDSDGDVNVLKYLDYITVITDITPVANFTVNTRSIIQGQFIQFTFTGSQGNVPTSYQWNFGDTPSNSTELNPAHTYLASGNFNVTITMMDGDDTAVFKRINYITVAVDIVPVATFTANITQIQENGWILFTFTGTEGNPNAIFKWNFGDGPDVIAPHNISHQFLHQGRYIITLTISDADGDVDTRVLNEFITVNGPSTNNGLDILKLITDNWYYVAALPVAMVIITTIVIRNKERAAKRAKKVGKVGKGGKVLPQGKLAGTEGKKVGTADTQNLEEGIAPKTAKELEEMRKTEQEVTAKMDVKLCVVHKGPIKGTNYSCPQCSNFYCLSCAATLASNAEGCWSCGHKIELDETLTATMLDQAVLMSKTMFFCATCVQYHELENINFDIWVNCPDCNNPMVFVKNCMFCSQPIALPKELYAEFKGKLMQCPNCNKNVKI